MWTTKWSISSFKFRFFSLYNDIVAQNVIFRRAGSNHSVAIWLNLSLCCPVVVESLHEAAYKNALCNSLYCPEYMVGNIKSEHVSIFTLFVFFFKFVSPNYTY